MHVPKLDVNDDKAWSVPVRAGLAAKAHRTTGHAAEMAFFAVLTLVPSTVAVGSALGLERRPDRRGHGAKAEDASVEAVRTLMGPELADKVIAPFVHAQLAQPRGGVAVIGLLVAWWLSSHLFMSTAHALDHAYHVEHGRTTVVQRFIALAFALISVGIVAASVELMVTGPLGNPRAASRAGSASARSTRSRGRCCAGRCCWRWSSRSWSSSIATARTSSTPAASACRGRWSARRCGSSRRPCSGLTAGCATRSASPAATPTWS